MNTFKIMLQDGSYLKTKPFDSYNEAMIHTAESGLDRELEEFDIVEINESGNIVEINESGNIVEQL